jgi:hypothetical protein
VSAQHPARLPGFCRPAKLRRRALQSSLLIAPCVTASTAMVAVNGRMEWIRGRQI